MLPCLVQQTSALPLLSACAVAGVDECASQAAVAEMEQAGATLLRASELLQQSRGAAPAEERSKAATIGGPAQQQPGAEVSTEE